MHSENDLYTLKFKKKIKAYIMLSSFSFVMNSKLTYMSFKVDFL